MVWLKAHLIKHKGAERNNDSWRKADKQTIHLSTLAQVLQGLSQVSVRCPAVEGINVNQWELGAAL